jgi:hypothetical protein
LALGLGKLEWELGKGEWFVWRTEQSVKHRGDSEATPRLGTSNPPATINRTFSYRPIDGVRPNPKVSYPDNGPDDAVNGIDWYFKWPWPI